MATLMRTGRAAAAASDNLLMRTTVMTNARILLTLLLPLGLMAAQTSERGRARMEKAIRSELVMLPYYGVFDNLAFKLDNGKVTLLGQVSRPSLKKDAERAVKTVEGVESVDNQIEILPTSPNDDRIRLATYRAIYGHTALNRYALQAVPPIHIIVKNGNVTLVGVVATEGDANIAKLQANGVPGVFKVESQLTVERPAKK